MDEPMECMNKSPECAGAVEYRPAPPYGERSYRRCEFHQEKRWAQYEGSLEQEAQSPIPPAWFDPSYAGERWDED